MALDADEASDEFGRQLCGEPHPPTHPKRQRESKTATGVGPAACRVSRVDDALICCIKLRRCEEGGAGGGARTLPASGACHCDLGEGSGLGDTEDTGRDPLSSWQG